MIEQAGTLPRIYAGALFQLAREEDALDERLEEVKALLEAIRSEPRFLEIIESPRVEAERKTAFVCSVIDERFSLDLRNLVLLLIEKNRQQKLLAILGAFVDLHDESAGRQRAVLTTAVPLEAATAESLARGLGERIGREVLLEEKVDPGILAGAVLRFGDYILDGSMRSRIETMKEDLLAPPGR